MAQSKMVKTFEDVEEKLRKRDGEEFKEYENLFTVNDCLMPFYIRGYESKYYSDDKEIAFTLSQSLVDVEKYYNNKSEVFDTDSDSDSDISFSRKAGRKRKLSLTSSSSPIVENFLIGDRYNITLEVMSTTDEEDN